MPLVRGFWIPGHWKTHMAELPRQRAIILNDGEDEVKVRAPGAWAPKAWAGWE